MIAGPDLRTVIFGLVNSLFMTTGIFFQKLNGVRGGHPILSWYILAAAIAYAPTMLFGNFALQAGGKISLFLAATATFYVWSTLLGGIVFGEPLNATVAAGILVIFAGIALVIRGAGA